MQVLEISSVTCGWKKQGACRVVDDEPSPPTDDEYASDRGWKEVTAFRACQGGGDYLFPLDQLLLVTPSGYRPLKKDDDRLLGTLSRAGRTNTNYLVWFHHLFRSNVLRTRSKKA